VLMFGYYQLNYLKGVILTSTKEGDIILDPLAGTGTTGYVARALKRDFVRYSKEISKTINFALY